MCKCRSLNPRFRKTKEPPTEVSRRIAARSVGGFRHLGHVFDVVEVSLRKQSPVGLPDLRGDFLLGDKPHGLRPMLPHLHEVGYHGADHRPQRKLLGGVDFELHLRRRHERMHLGPLPFEGAQDAPFHERFLDGDDGCYVEAEFFADSPRVRHVGAGVGRFGVAINLARRHTVLGSNLRCFVSFRPDHVFGQVTFGATADERHTIVVERADIGRAFRRSLLGIVAQMDDRLGWEHGVRQRVPDVMKIPEYLCILQHAVNNRQCITLLGSLGPVHDYEQAGSSFRGELYHGNGNFQSILECWQVLQSRACSCFPYRIVPEARQSDRGGW